MNIYQAPDKIKVPWDTEVSAGSQIFDRPSIIQIPRFPIAFYPQDSLYRTIKPIEDSKEFLNNFDIFE